MHFTFGDTKIPYDLKESSRARHMRVTIFPDGHVVVTVPARRRRTTLGSLLGIVDDEGLVQLRIEKFLREKGRWIAAKVAHAQKNPPSFLMTRVPGGLEKYKEQAAQLVSDRLTYFNQFYGFRYNKISIKDQKTRWGSCSRRGNLNFSYKLALLPQAQADYVVVHELCHLQQLNHSRKFWELVARTIPDYKKIRRELHKIR